MVLGQIYWPIFQLVELVLLVVRLVLLYIHASCKLNIGMDHFIFERGGGGGGGEGGGGRV